MPEASDWAAVCRFGGIGDNLIAAAVLPALRERYGHVEVITQRPQHVVFENNPHVDKLSVYSPGDIPGGDSDAWQGWFETRAREYRFFANLSHSCETLRALSRGQTQFYWSDKFRRKMCGQSYLETVADVCDVPYETLEPRFYPTDAELAEAAASRRRHGFEGRTIAWVLSGTRLDKIYSYAPMAVARLIREVGPVICLGAPSERERAMAETIEAHVRQQNGSVDGLIFAMSPSFENETWPIRRVLTVAQTCDLVVGPDTGPMWACSMLDVPKVMLLSHASPENITKYWRNTVTLHADAERVPCWPCHRLIDLPRHCRPNREEKGAACISDISVDRLLSTVKSLWEVKNADRPAIAAPELVSEAVGNPGVGRGRRGNAVAAPAHNGASHPAG